MPLVIDDFGTDYSNLSRLRRLPASSLKIDRSFVRDIVEDENDLAIVGAIVSMADAIGLNVVAEGIENDAQAALLRSMGCRFGQGFHYCHPLSAAQVTTMLTTALISA